MKTGTISLMYSSTALCPSFSLTAFVLQCSCMARRTAGSFLSRSCTSCRSVSVCRLMRRWNRCTTRIAARERRVRITVLVLWSNHNKSAIVRTAETPMRSQTPADRFKLPLGLSLSCRIRTPSLSGVRHVLPWVGVYRRGPQRNLPCESAAGRAGPLCKGERYRV